MNVENLISLYLADVCAGKTNETPAAYRSKLKRFVGYIGEREVESISTDDLKQFQIFLLNRETKLRGSKEVDGKLSPFTVRTVMVTVRALFRWALINKLIGEDITTSVRLVRLPQPDPKAVSCDTVNALIQAAAEHGEIWQRSRNLAILYMLIDTGCRVGAVVKADLEDLDIKRGKIMIREKGCKSALKTLCDPTMQIFRTWLSYRSTLLPETTRLFITYKLTEFKRGGIYSMLRELAKTAGVKTRFNPHSYRHAYARECLQNGADLSQVSQLMMHSRSSVTADYYARWADRELAAIQLRVSPGRNLPIISL